MATPVGALACQKDTFLRKLKTKIISATIPAVAAAAAGSKKPVASPTGSSNKKLVEIILQDTVLFPEGGGQPCDFGTLTTSSAPSVIKISNVVRRGNTCVHFTEVESEADQENLVKSVLVEGQDVEVEVDWPRRLDHAQHHTGQHLLTAVVEQITSLPTESWALSYPTCNILLGRKEITADEVAKIEARCNELIQQNVPVNSLSFATRADVPEARSRGIPADVTGPIRMIEIPGVDACTCCGTHIGALGQLGMLKLLHQEPKGNTVRLHFVVGERVRAYFSEMYARERALMKDYGRAPEQIVEASDARSKQLAALTKSEKKLRQELTGYLAPTVVAAAAAPTTPAQAVYFYHREDVDSDMLLAFCEALTKSGTTANRMCVLAGGDTLKGEGFFMIVGPDEASVKTFSEKTFLPAVGNGTKGNYVKGVFRGKFNNIAGGWKDLVKATPCWPPAPEYKE